MMYCAIIMIGPTGPGVSVARAFVLVTETA